jgi:hypothetical protein
MSCVIRANVSRASEWAKQPDNEANEPPNARSWPVTSTVAETAVSF